MQKRHAEPSEFGITVTTSQVKKFPLYRWREAFKFWQDEIWSGHYSFNGFASIWINSRQETHRKLQSTMDITFLSHSGLYHATSHTPDQLPSSLKTRLFSGKDTVVADDGSSSSVEVALARFIRDRKWRLAVIHLSDPTYTEKIIMMNERGRLLFYGYRGQG